jgi:TolB-like protein/tetratricopeptide (TPR) repeat protein/tRNA A-37 threonylcarbamoyl transferase component Bud32
VIELERLFHEALDRPESERRDFVALACGDNAALAREVESLLEHHRQETGSFAAVVQPVAAEMYNAMGEIQPGAMLGPYRVESKVGAGGMGTVYAALDTRLGRKVAIKMLRQSFGDRTADLARFHTEARAAAALAHNNLAVLYDFGESDGAPWLVMEFVTGTPLRARLQSKPMAEDTVLRYAAQLAAALEHAHSRGIVHRDIKPENILLTDDGHLKVIDFGIASIARTSEEYKDGASVGFLGTLAYAAPELLSGGEETESSDIYSFGVVMYEMACGAHPFGALSGAALTAAILRSDYVRARTRNPALSSSLAATIDRCLSLDPVDRYRDGTKLMAVLRSIMGTQEAPPPAMSGVDSVAVLDFSNISGDEAIDWLGTGIAEVLASRLTKVRSLHVTNRARVRQVADRWRSRNAGAPLDPCSIVDELKVRWVVSGSFQRIGDRVRVTPQLLDAASDEVRLSVTIDGRWDDLFEIQDRVATLVETMAQELGSVDRRTNQTAQTRNMMAYEHYTKGRQQMSAMRPGESLSAIEHLEQAVALDPDFALAHSALGIVTMLRFLHNSNPEDAKRAGTYLERAVALDPELGEPYPWLSNVRMRKNDAVGSLAAGRKGVELQPDLAIAHYFHGGIAYFVAESRLSDVCGGAAALAEAIRLQPRLHPAWLLLGATAAWGGQHQAAIRILSEAIRLETEPDLVYRFVGARTLRATAWMRSGNWSEAREGFEDAVRTGEPEHFYRECFGILNVCGLGDIAIRQGNMSAALAYYRQAWRLVKETPCIVGNQRLLIRSAAGMAAAYAAMGDRRRARELALDAAGQLESLQLASVTFECGLSQLHLALAVALIRLKDHETAAAHLDRAREFCWNDLSWLLVDPELRPLHHDPAYTRLVNQLQSAPQFEAPIPSQIAGISRSSGL